VRVSNYSIASTPLSIGSIFILAILVCIVVSQCGVNMHFPNKKELWHLFLHAVHHLPIFFSKVLVKSFAYVLLGYLSH
jgi:hypothetical protein